MTKAFTTVWAVLIAAGLIVSIVCIWGANRATVAAAEQVRATAAARAAR